MVKNNYSICLILAEAYETNMPSRSSITEIYGKYLPSLGHKITWISFSDKNIRDNEIKKYNKVDIYIIKRLYYRHISKKFCGFLIYYANMYKLINKLMIKEKFDIIQVRDDVFSALIGLHFRNVYNIPLAFQYSFPKQTFKLRSKISIEYYYGKINYILQMYVLRRADLVFPISKWMEADLIKLGIPKSKMMQLPMGINPELFSKSIEDRTYIRQKYYISDSQVLLYLGAISKLRSLDVLLYAFSKVLKEKSTTKLLMVGKGDDFNNIKELSKKLGIYENVIFTGNVSYFDVPKYINAADVCLCLVPPLEIYKISSPTKLFEYMAIGKPTVINEEIYEQKEVVQKSNCGVLVTFNAESIANGILDLLNNKTKATKMGENGNSWVLNNRLYENMAKDIEKRYDSILVNKDLSDSL